MNLLDSHDVPRALHSLHGDVPALKLALLLIFLQPGAPCIYYGTEAGLAGGPETEHSSGPEPGCREAFPWEADWPHDLRNFIASLSKLRRNVPAFRQGDLHWTSLGADGLHAVGAGVWVWINRSRHTPCLFQAVCRNPYFNLETPTLNVDRWEGIRRRCESPGELELVTSPYKECSTAELQGRVEVAERFEPT